MDRELLRRGGLRAYELGRLRAATRAAWLLVPVVVACALATGATEPCACVGVALLGAAIFLRWRSWRGAQSVRDGLAAGALPMLAGLIVGWIAPMCSGTPLAYAAVCLLAGAPAGAWLGLRLARGRSSLSAWLSATGIAVLASSLGCVGVGVAAVIGAAAGLVAGVAVASIAKRTT